MLDCIYYVHAYILTFNFQHLNVFYSSVEIFLRCCFHMKKNKYDETFLLLKLTTKKVFKCSIHGQIPLG